MPEQFYNGIQGGAGEDYLREPPDAIEPRE
jgi:hypothetical protein